MSMVINCMPGAPRNLYIGGFPVHQKDTRRDSDSSSPVSAAPGNRRQWVAAGSGPRQNSEEHLGMDDAGKVDPLAVPEQNG